MSQCVLKESLKSVKETSKRSTFFGISESHWKGVMRLFGGYFCSRIYAMEFI